MPVYLPLHADLSERVYYSAACVSKRFHGWPRNQAFHAAITKTTVRTGGVLYVIRSEMVHRFQIYKNHRRRCCISGIIVLNVRLRPISVASALRRRRRSNTPVQRNQHGEGDTNFSHFNKASFQLYKTS